MQQFFHFCYICNIFVNFLVKFKYFCLLNASMPSITEITSQYISEHRSINDCVKKGLINYSALARLISAEMNLGKRASRGSILMAARRLREKMKGFASEDEILLLFSRSNVEIKNNIMIFTLDKNIYPEMLIEIEKTIKKRKELFFSIEGTKTITIIVQWENKKLIEQKFRNNIMKKREDLSLITISSPGIEKIPGAVYYLSGLFFENGINIEEFMSCHHDTLIVIESKNINKAMKFLIKNKKERDDD